MKKLLMLLLAMVPMCVFAQFDAAPVVTARVVLGDVKGNSGEGVTKSCLDAIKANMASSLTGGRLTLTTDAADADYKINVNVINETHSKKDSEYKGKVTTTYTTTINYAYEVVNTSDNSVFNTYTYESKQSSTESAEKARLKAEDCGYCSSLVMALCPLRGNVIDVEELDKKGKRVEKLYINIGSMHKVHKDECFDVCSTRMVAGRNVDKPIAQVLIKSIEGEDVSLCEVTKNKEGEAVKMALDAGETLVVKSGVKKTNFLGF